MRCPIWASMFLSKTSVLTNCCSMVVLFLAMFEKCSHTLNFFLGSFWKTHLGWKVSPLAPTTFIFWSTIKICLGFWTFYNFFSFIDLNTHIFHHISTLMPLTIQCIVEGTFVMIITWNSICNLVIFVLFANCIKLLFVSNWSPQESRDGSQHLNVKLHPYIHP
jgi:hypothetical protein